MQTRCYTVAGQTFAVTLEEPWRFMEYTPVVADRIRRAAAGEALPIEPVRAGDDVPARTYVSRKEELPADMDRHTLDFSQYEPFLDTEGAEADFTLRVAPAGYLEPPVADALAQRETQLTTILRIDSELPWYYIYRMADGRTLFEFEPRPGQIAGYLVMDEQEHNGTFYPAEGMRPYATVYQISTILMIMYTYNASSHGILLLHASAIRLEGKAYLFLGTSGTGKSTHSRLWLENIPGAELLNDDNPALKASGDGIRIYGTPWSGKTPCYRRVAAPAGGIVRLHQAPQNSIAPVQGLKAYADVISSASSIRWRRDIMDALSATAERVVTEVPVWKMGCLPDADAARLCRETVAP